MTDRKQHLTDLLAKVEAGVIPHSLFDWTDESWPKGVPASLCDRSYHGSLDAAKALHEAVLPGWDYLLCSDGSAGGEAEGPIAVVLPDACADHDRDTYDSGSDNPARAWLIAIIKALISMEYEA